MDSSEGLNTVTAIKDRFPGMAILIVHHEGHQIGRARGWSGLKAGADAEFRVTLENDISILECTKAKDSEFATAKAFKLKVINLGISDDDGVYITSGVLEETEYKPMAKEDKPRLGANQKKLIRLIKEMPDKTIEELKVDAKERYGMNRYTWRDAFDGLMEREVIKVEEDYVKIIRGV
jgi:hypothetical protein